MKYLLLIILTILSFPSIGQEIEKIIFTSQQADEPPTKQGRPKYTIEFNRQASGEFTTSDFSVDKKKKKLKDRVTIKKERIEKITNWRNLNKKTFSQSDLGLEIADLKLKTNKYKLTFDIPSDLVIKIDSFQFCQTYQMTRTISTGGETFSVTLIEKEGQKQEIVFDSNDIGEKTFNIRDYILCYTLFADNIPSEVPSYDFFSKETFLDIILYYQKTVECEGYYYKEYTDKNPQLTAPERRMMKGWNFVDYMKQRTEKK